MNTARVAFSASHRTAQLDGSEAFGVGDGADEGFEAETTVEEEEAEQRYLVETIEQRLQDLGYSVLVDGIRTEETDRAIEAFAAQRRLRRPAVPDEALLGALDTAIKERHSVVTRAERALIALGYYDGRADGKIDGGAQSALDRFRKAYRVRESADLSDTTIVGQLEAAVAGAGALNRRVERSLIDLGRLRGRPDERLDPATQAAMDRFRKDAKLSGTGGAPDPALADALDAAVARARAQAQAKAQAQVQAKAQQQAAAAAAARPKPLRAAEPSAEETKRDVRLPSPPTVEQDLASCGAGDDLACERALQRSPQQGAGRIDLLLQIAALIAPRDLSAGLDYLAQAQTLEPANDRVWAARGDVLRRAGREEEALAAYGGAQRLAPPGTYSGQIFDLRSRLALAAATAAERQTVGPLVEACRRFDRRACDQALSYPILAGAERADVLRLRALLLLAQQDTKGALTDLVEARQLAPREPAIAEAQGRVFERMQRPEDAIASYREAQQLAAGDDAGRFDARIAELEQRLEAARRREATQRTLAEAQLKERTRRIEAALARLGSLYEPVDGEITDEFTRITLASYRARLELDQELDSEEMAVALEAEVAKLEQADLARVAADAVPPQLDVPAEIAWDDGRRGAPLTLHVHDDHLDTVTVDGAPTVVDASGAATVLIRDIRRNGQRSVAVVARDKAGNETRRTVVATRRAGATTSANLASLNPFSVKGRANPNAFAIIIGITDYETISPALFAADDANRFADYAEYVLGIAPERIALITDREATTRGILEHIDEILHGAVDDASEVYVFFSGHGFSRKDDNAPLLLASDFSEAVMEYTSLPEDTLIDKVRSYGPKSVTLFTDACFSGRDRMAQNLLPSAKLLQVDVERGSESDEAAIVTSSSGSDISLALEPVGQGAFSYVLMRGLEGPADTDRDKAITLSELYAYIRRELPRHARSQGRPQLPWYNAVNGESVVARLQ